MRVRASLAVEAAILFPLILILLFSFVQVGLFLGMNQWAESVTEQALDTFQTGIRAGKTKDELKILLDEELQSAIDISLLTKEKCQKKIEVSQTVFGPQVRVRLSLVYEFLFSQTILIDESQTAGSLRDMRDMMQLAEESVNRIPEVREWMDKYKEKMKEWAQKLLG